MKFFHQIVANLPWNATELVRFLETFEIWVFLGKIDGLFRKKTLKFFKIAKCSKFFVEYVLNCIISFKCLSSLFVTFFGKKSENF